MYENPSQRKSKAEAFSVGRFASVRKKMLVWVERVGDFKMKRIESRRTITRDKAQALFRDKYVKANIASKAMNIKIIN